MANLQRVLGTMLATGAGGHSRRGPAFASSAAGLGAASLLGGGGGGLAQKAGLGALAYLAYKAYQDYQSGSASRTPDTGARDSGRRESGGRESGPSLGERLSGMLGGGQQPEEPAPAVEEISDAKALLLIRAMIAAANADGEISAEERRQIMSKLDEAGAGPDERQAIERELARPRSVDEIARDVQDQETAEQVYLASRVAMNPDTPAERAYLQYLAARLKLPEERIQDIQSVA